MPRTQSRPLLSSVSGSITHNACEWLRSELRRERFGQNVHIFDGERLHQLDLSATYRQQQLFLPRLSGLRSHLELNLIVWDSMLKSLPSFAEGRGCFTRAFEDYLASPFLSPPVPLNEVSILLQECRIIDRINNRYLSPHAPSGELRDREIETIRWVIEKAQARTMSLLALIKTLSRLYSPLTMFNG